MDKNDILANQMISGDSKGVNNRHVWFSSITSSGKGCKGQCTSTSVCRSAGY